MQTDEVNRKKMGLKSYEPLGFSIYRLKDQSSTKRSKFTPDELDKTFVCLRYVTRREFAKSFNLAPGSYVLLPSTFNEGVAMHFLLRVFIRDELATNEGEGGGGGGKMTDMNDHSSSVFVDEIEIGKLGKFIFDQEVFLMPQAPLPEVDHANESVVAARTLIMNDLSKEEARNLFVKYAESQSRSCCNKNVAQEINIVSTKTCAAYEYHLETFSEIRSVTLKCSPTRKEENFDQQQQQQQNLVDHLDPTSFIEQIWSIEVQSSRTFSQEIKSTEVPNFEMKLVT
jgi:hypothetical protein